MKFKFKDLLRIFSNVVLILCICILSFLSGYILSKPNNEVSNEANWMDIYAGQEKQISDRISDYQIQAFNDRLVVSGKYSLASYSNTDSMLPLLDSGSTGIYLPVYNDTDLRIGDVISFNVPGEKGFYIHRIVDIRVDDDGAYFVTKGDNLKQADPVKTRRQDVIAVLVGILW